MPVTTRSKNHRPSDLLSAPANMEPRPSNKPSIDTVGGSSGTTAPNISKKQLLLASKKARRPKRARLSSPKSQKRVPKHPTSDETKQPQIATDPASPDLPCDAVMHWPCQLCSCPRGVFKYPVDACIRCGHGMDHHEETGHPWNAECDNVCERKDLVCSVLRLLETMGVVVIRATPQVGKTTLLHLLGRHILDNRKDLEPVFVHWKSREERKGFLPFRYEEYLEDERSIWLGKNANYRPCNPKAKTVYLIDEAQRSYEEVDFWARKLKNPGSRNKPLFVLACLYGVDVSIGRSLDIESQSLNIDAAQRVELRPSRTRNPHLLFNLAEMNTVVQKWAIRKGYELESGVCEYLHTATDGHPGMVGLVLRTLESWIRKSTEATRNRREWTPNLCHMVIVEHEELIDELTTWGRGLWTTKGMSTVHQYLRGNGVQGITFSDITNALRKVVTQPHGYTPEDTLDVFQLCYALGFLHKEKPRRGSRNATYIFASPIHRRVAYRQLCPGPEPGTSAERITLQQACLNAIQRFSSSVLHPRTTKSPGRWGIPEAAFQDEMYCCLNYELQSLPILSEYSHTSDGRIDFYIFDKKWGIEVLQCGNKTKVTEHAARFTTGGKYREWNIFEDYIILNFCSKATIQEIDITGFDISDPEIQSHILQIVVDSKENTAEVYTHDKQLRARLILGEGRQRHYSDDDESLSKPSQDADALKFLQGRLAQMEQEKEDREQRMEQENEDREQRMEQEKEDMKQQMEQLKRQVEQMREDKKPQMDRTLE